MDKEKPQDHSSRLNTDFGLIYPKVITHCMIQDEVLTQKCVDGNN